MMHELLFPISALALTFFVLIPALSALSHMALESRRNHAQTWASFGSETTFAWLVAPVLLPMVWLSSSAMHQSESVRAATVCLTEHVESGACVDVLILLTMLTIGTIALIGHRVWMERPRLRLERLDEQHPLVRQVARLVRTNDALRDMRFVVVRGSPEPLYTLGYVRPVVVIDACFLEESDSELLRAAFLHELAHVTGRDTLRSLIARLCLSINPARAWLAPNYQRWRSAREAACDGEAVLRGGEPLALAQGLLRAARFECGGCGPCAAPLCGHDVAALKLRLALLMGTPPRPTKTLGHVALLLGVVIAVTVPHVQGLEFLDLFHVEVERILHALS